MGGSVAGRRIWLKLTWASQMSMPPPMRKLLTPKRKIGGTIVKTHQPFRLGAPYNRFVCVVRDPRDVIPSYFRYLSRKNGLSDIDFEDFASACTSGSIWPGSWFEHVTSWRFFRSKHSESIDIFRFEDLVALDENEILRFGEALLLSSGVDLPSLFEQYDLETMRKLEIQGNRSSEKAPGFIGQGRATADRQRIVDTLIQKNAPHWRELMASVGYV